VLQTAAVIGRQFTEPILRRVLELPEADLARALVCEVHQLSEPDLQR